MRGILPWLAALGLSFLALVVVWVGWFLASVFADVYLTIGSTRPSPGWGYTLARRLFAPIAEEVDRQREATPALKEADPIMRRSWWPLHALLLVLFCLMVALFRLLLRGGWI